MTTFSPGSGTHGARRCLATRLLQCPIINGKSETIGTIEDLVLDDGDRRVGYVVVSVRGTPPLDSKYFAMPWRLIEVVRADGDQRFVGSPMRVTMNIARETMIAAPGFEQDHWPDAADGRWAARQDSHYRPGGAAAADSFDSHGNKRIDAGYAQESTAAAATVDHRRLTRIIGMGIVDSQHQALSSVADLVLDLDRGSIDGIVLVFDGVAGVDERIVLVPADSVSLDAVEDVFVLPSDRRRLETMAIPFGFWPRLDSDDWLVGGREALAASAGRAAHEEARLVPAHPRIERVRGFILTLDFGSRRSQAPRRLRILVRTDAGPEVLVLGADVANERQAALALRSGQNVDIRGWAATQGFQDLVVATSITAGGRTMLVEAEP